MTDTIEGTAVEVDAPAAPPTPTSQIVALERAPHSTELIAGSPTDRVAAATEMATALDQVIRQQGMRTKVGRAKVVRPDGSEEYVDRYHVNVEGWQTLGTFLGLAVVPVWSRRVIDPTTGQPERVTFTVHEKTYHPRNQGGGIKAERTFEIDGFNWEARVETYKDGALIGAGEAMCSRTEGTWKERDDYALRGMAQTRATSRAIAGVARWIVTLAGYSATPAEEMPPEGAEPEAPAGPPYGPWADADQVGLAKRSLKALCAGDATVAAEQWAALRAELGVEHMPLAAAAAIVLVAKAARATGPDLPWSENFEPRAGGSADEASPDAPAADPADDPQEDTVNPEQTQLGVDAEPTAKAGRARGRRAEKEGHDL